MSTYTSCMDKIYALASERGISAEKVDTISDKWHERALLHLSEASSHAQKHHPELHTYNQLFLFIPGAGPPSPERSPVMYNDYVEQKQMLYQVTELMEQAGKSLEHEVGSHKETKVLLKQQQKIADEKETLRALAESFHQKSMALLKLFPSQLSRMTGENKEINGYDVDYKYAYSRVLDLAHTQNEYFVAMEAHNAKEVVDAKQRAANAASQNDMKILREDATWAQHRIFDLQHEHAQISQAHAQELKKLNSRIKMLENDKLQKLKSIEHSRSVTGAKMEELNGCLGKMEKELHVMRQENTRLQKELNELKKKQAPAVQCVKRVAEAAENLADSKPAKKIKEKNGI